MNHHTFSPPLSTLRLSMDQELIKRFATVLQAGFYRDTVQGQTILSFLLSLPGFSKDYIADRLQTVFLNGDSVDDMEISFSADKATLALSAAMPGLAGSLFRKNSPLISLRKTAAQKTLGRADARVTVQVKLFNVIALETGIELFKQGVILNCSDLISFLKLRPTLINGMVNTTLDERSFDPQELFNIIGNYQKIQIICTPTNE